jgi:toxin YoeB
LSGRKRPRPTPLVDEKTAAGPESRRQLIFDDVFLQDLQFWVRTDPRTADRLLKLVELVRRDPFHGLGKPEPLKRLRNTWSRRLTDEDRLTYIVTDSYIQFLQARFHYTR